MSDLDVIKPAATSATFGGREVQIQPLKVGQLPAFARAIKPLGAAIEQVATGAKALNLAALLDMVAEHGDAVIEATAIGSGVQRAELEQGTPDELITLAVAVLKVNADFFRGRLTPAVVAAVAKASPMPGAGPTP
ncbi:MAG: hypothetical protein AB7P94_16845 [Steroidobacteraceae bacterium]